MRDVVDRVARLLPGAVVVRATPLHGGNFNDVVRLDCDRAGVAFTVVARRSRTPDMAARITRSAPVLIHLADRGLAVPRVVGMDHCDGDAMIVLDYVDGTARPMGLSLEAELSERAALLVALHSTARLPDLPPASSLIDEGMIEWWAPDPRLADVLDALAKLERPTCRAPGLVHGDFWTGNIVWNGNRIAAAIDWDRVGIGCPMLDLAKVRLDVALVFGSQAADRLLAAYVEAGGPVHAEEQAYCDLVVSLEGMPDPGRGWWPTYASLNVDVTADAVRRNYADYLAATLRRAGVESRA